MRLGDGVFLPLSAGRIPFPSSFLCPRAGAKEVTGIQASPLRGDGAYVPRRCHCAL